jgi:hypothetical protein
MAASNAERQRAYRARRAIASTFGDRRLNLWIDGRAANALARLAAHHGLTRRAMLERILNAADQQVQGDMSPGSEAWSAYFAAGRS